MNLSIEIAVIDEGGYCSTVPKVKVLLTALSDSHFGFAHLKHETLQKGAKRSKTALSVHSHDVLVDSRPLGFDPELFLF